VPDKVLDIRSFYRPRFWSPYGLELYELIFFEFDLPLIKYKFGDRRNFFVETTSLSGLRVRRASRMDWQELAND
jgi:hypothetical protein